MWDIEALGDTQAFTLDGNAFAVDFDGLVDLAAIAGALQTGIRTVAAYATATVTVVGTGFVIQGGADYNFGTGFTDNSVSQTLGLVGDTVSVLANAEAEDIDGALDRIAGLDCTFFWLAAAPSITQDDVKLTAVRTWTAARGFDNGCLLDLFGEGVLVTGETASLGATLSALRGNGIGAIWNGRTAAAIDQKGLSFMARFSSINFNAPNAIPNGKFLQLPGTTPTELTASEKAELLRKRINYYLPVGRSNDADTEEGQTFGTWIDVFIGIAWFKNALQVAGYNYLKQSSPLGGVPITDQGLAGVADALEEVCDLAVRNGLLAPNTVSPVFRAAIARATNNPDFDGFLSTGYIVVRPTAAQVDQTLRNARGPIPIAIYAKGSGKINSLDIGVDFEN